MHRAIDERDTLCGLYLILLFDKQVRSWCSRAGAKSDADAEVLARDAWEKFWRGFSSVRPVRSVGTEWALRYLKLCAMAAVVDAGRRERVELWDVVCGHLRGDRERLLMRLLYDVGLKAREVHAAAAEQFPSVGDIHRLTLDIFERLRRGHDLDRWLQTEVVV
jgi:hypothetical protein